MGLQIHKHMLHAAKDASVIGGGCKHQVAAAECLEIMVEGWVEEASYIAMFLIPLSASLQARILAAFSVFP